MINKILCIDLGLFEKPFGRFLLIVFYIVLALLPAFIALFILGDFSGGIVETVGQTLGLVALGILSMQVILGSRFHIADKGFGLDKVMSFHRKMGIAALVMLILHPVLLAISHSEFALLYSFSMGALINIGKITLLLLIIVIFVALYFSKFGIDYNKWRLMHKSAIFVVVLGFVHSLIARDDGIFEGKNVLWFIMFMIPISVYLYRNLLWPFIARKKYTIEEIKQETHDTFSLYLKPIAKDIGKHKPGQFMFIKLCLERCEEHPFTIPCVSDDSGNICATVKKSGNFTNKIDNAKEGDTVLVDGPYGRFSFIYDNPENFVFIAGGVGITPILAMLRYLRETKDDRQIVLLYANKSEKDIIFRKELETMPDNFKIVHCLSRQEEWDGCKGHVDFDNITINAGEIIDSADFYICGPPPMMAAVIQDLKSGGISKEKIHFEKFSIHK